LSLEGSCNTGANKRVHACGDRMETVR